MYIVQHKLILNRILNNINCAKSYCEAFRIETNVLVERFLKLFLVFSFLFFLSVITERRCLCWKL